VDGQAPGVKGQAHETLDLHMDITIAGVADWEVIPGTSDAPRNDRRLAYIPLIGLHTEGAGTSG